MQGRFTLRRGTLSSNQLAQAAMGCEPFEADQEQWISEALLSGVEAQFVGLDLVLTDGEGVSVTFRSTF